jgi:nicotinamidase-related amidase
VIIGLTTDHYVSATVRMAKNYECETFLISPATPTFDKKGVNGDAYVSEVELFELYQY